MRKGTLHQENITFLKIYAPNQGVPKFIKQLLTYLKGRNRSKQIIVGDINTQLIALDKSTK